MKIVERIIGERIFNRGAESIISLGESWVGAGLQGKGKGKAGRI